MSWGSINGEEKQLEIIQVGEHSWVTSFQEYDPNHVIVPLDRLAEGINVIINPCTFETFKTKVEIPYQIKDSTEKGIIEEIYARVRDKDFLVRVLIKPKGKVNFKLNLFSQDFRYTRRPSTSTLPEFDDYIFSSEMSVASISRGIFNFKIQTHLEELAQKSHAALESDIYRCIKFMQQEAASSLT